MALGKIVKNEEPLWKQRGIVRDRNDVNSYKIRCGYAYWLRRGQYKNGNTFYYIVIGNRKGGLIGYKRIVFSKKNGKPTDFPDYTRIIPLKLMESWFPVEAGVYPKFFLIFLDWEVRLTPKQLAEKQRQEALEKYSEERNAIDYEKED